MPRGKTLAARSRGLKIPKKGERFGGRQKGTPNQTTRELKEALFLAAEASRHSDGKGLVGYLTHLADNEKALYVRMLARMIPLQAKIDGDANVNHIIKAKPEELMTPQELAEYYKKLCDLPASSKPLVIDYDTGE
jgi:hypothetical protein